MYCHQLRKPWTYSIVVEPVAQRLQYYKNYVQMIPIPNGVANLIPELNEPVTLPKQNDKE